MTGSVRRRSSLSRDLLALGGAFVLALLALAAVLTGASFGDHGHRSDRDVHSTTISAVGGHDHAAFVAHAFHQQPLTRARSVAFAMLASAAVVAAWTSRRVRIARRGRARTLRIVGLPSGRAPPTLRIA
jgi:hypothetical protein